MKLFDCACRAILGERERQEDSFLLWPPHISVFPNSEQQKSQELLAILSDGMGGHVGGEIASHTISKAFAEAFVKAEGDISRRLDVAIHSANKKLAKTIDNNPSYLGMGATVLAVFFCNDTLQWISVGDSLLYLFRKGKITILNEDHSMAPVVAREFAQLGSSLKREDQDPRRNMLRSAITGGEISLIDLAYCPFQLENSDYIILASDGILSLPHAELEKELSLNEDRGPQYVAQSIIEAIEGLYCPFQDNTTLVVVRHLDKN